jgi:hypothetical protein
MAATFTVHIPVNSGANFYINTDDCQFIKAVCFQGSIPTEDSADTRFEVHPGTNRKLELRTDHTTHISGVGTATKCEAQKVTKSERHSIGKEAGGKVL